ncbi:MAG TPA: exodeoxyribonuclease VII small subunit [Patescibacteria group bacterium]|nr:exodeoxyribonuclease VII small subunit [Patescibacteria group bacterium]
MAKTKQDRSFDFGAAYKELEEIIGWFEKEEVDLEEGLKKFERGLALAKGCKERLKEVENKVVQIKAKFGELDEEDGEPQRLL